jgi:RNA polymerase sigma-70 factor (ECF subfamily)
MVDLPHTAQGWRRLVRKIRRFAKTDDHAHDLLQGAVLRLVQRSPHEEINNIESYIVKSAANIAIDEHRHDVVKVESIYIFESFARCDPYPLQDEVLMARERLETVKFVLGQMPERTREVFLMHRLDGMKYREIAATFGISVSAVEKHIARATQALIENSEAF